MTQEDLPQSSGRMLFRCDVDNEQVTYIVSDSDKEWGCTCYGFPRTHGPRPKCEHIEIALDVRSRPGNPKPDRVRNVQWFDQGA